MELGLDLSIIRTRLDRTTLAPWAHDGKGFIFSLRDPKLTIVRTTLPVRQLALFDCDFIAGAREYVPALIARIEQLEKEKAELERRLVPPSIPA